MEDRDHVTEEQVKANLDEALAPYANNQRDSLEGDNDAYEVYSDKDDHNRDDGRDGGGVDTTRDEL